ncbi:hypothetical protein GCM10018790_77220 [Kitasatospora xanthocidica]|nr:hypothetical protein GCM10018790_77220 [Kitasatospora xanthocidica]
MVAEAAGSQSTQGQTGGAVESVTGTSKQIRGGVHARARRPRGARTDHPVRAPRGPARRRFGRPAPCARKDPPACSARLIPGSQHTIGIPAGQLGVSDES